MYVEAGAKRRFAGSIDWPGWCRSGRDESSAIESLAAYGPRYERALRGARLAFRLPASASFDVVERLKGDATTDFGAPARAPSVDAGPVDDAELRRFGSLLKACWRTFDASTQEAEGKELRKGPRGGGRELEAIAEHVIGADEAYLGRLAYKLEKGATEPSERLQASRQAILDALTSAAHGEVAERGPRGGVRWTPRYFVRRVAWHVLDHAWEIEDRAV